MSSVTTRELFRYVQLEIVRFWDQLVWLDAANSAGIVCHRPDLDEQPLEQVEIEMQFNIATYLPAAVQDDFTAVIGRFVHGMLVAKRQQADDLRTPLRILQNASSRRRARRLTARTARPPSPMPPRSSSARR